MSETDSEPTIHKYIVLFGIVILVFLHEMLIKNNIDVFFVLLNDPDCDNSNNDRAHVHACQSEHCGNKLFKNISEKIDSAQSAIDIAMYNFTNYQLVRSIQKACKRGVAVRLILDRSMIESEDRRRAENNRLILRNLIEFGT